MVAQREALLPQTTGICGLKSPLGLEFAWFAQVSIQDSAFLKDMQLGDRKSLASPLFVFLVVNRYPVQPCFGKIVLCLVLVLLLFSPLRYVS